MLRTALRTQALRLSTPAVLATRLAAPKVASVPAFRNLRFYSEEAKKEAAEEAKDEPKDELTLLKEALESAKKDTAQFKDRYLRATADFRNLQESTKREIKKSKELALKSFAKDLVEVVDTFDIALKVLAVEEGSTAEKKSKELDDLIEGVQITQNMFVNTLKRHGLEKIEAVGEKFDPNMHEATFEAPQPDKEPGTVFFVQQPGYFLNGRVLRPAKVGVVQDAA